MAFQRVLCVISFTLQFANMYKTAIRELITEIAAPVKRRATIRIYTYTVDQLFVSCIEGLTPGSHMLHQVLAIRTHDPPDQKLAALNHRAS